MYKFKIGTIGDKQSQDWIVVENQHEALIDRMSFEIVQEKLKSRQRQGQNGEISLFAGLLKCGECGRALTIRATNAKHPQKIYACKTCNACGGFSFFLPKKKKEQAAKESVDPDADCREDEEKSFSLTANPNRMRHRTRTCNTKKGGIAAHT